MGKNVFVFVVCGDSEHIDTLHYSLKYLKHFSKSEIVVVTDSARNAIPVKHDNIVQVDTPESFTHHQASIYLKTGLHKFLSKGNSYCYLDTDVIALSSDCDLVFSQRKRPVTFAADHCLMPKFSPSAVKCGCLKENKEDRIEIEHLMQKYNPAMVEPDPVMLEKKRVLHRKFDKMKRDRWQYFWIGLRFNLAPYRFKLDDDTYYYRWSKTWKDKDGRVIIPHPGNMVKDIEANTGWRFNKERQSWISPRGKDIYYLECPHLAQYISDRFGIKVSNLHFQHWNGGVFLFDDSSHDFLEAWFDKTMKIFTYSDWMTRDQGTLIATVWEFGLQNQELLPQRFNFIADYNNHQLMLDENGNMSTDGFQTKTQPALIHIYHNFGRKGWEIWDHVEKIGRQEGIIT